MDPNLATDRRTKLRRPSIVFSLEFFQAVSARNEAALAARPGVPIAQALSPEVDPALADQGRQECRSQDRFDAITSCGPRERIRSLDVRHLRSAAHASCNA